MYGYNRKGGKYDDVLGLGMERVSFDGLFNKASQSRIYDVRKSPYKDSN